jgi:hypothetical protein
MADDLDWIVSTARQHDVSLDHVVAQTLAAEALEVLAGLADVDAPEIARRLLAAHPEHGASSANVVARAAVDYVTRGESP